MTRDDRIREALARMGGLVTPPASFEDGVMRRIERRPGAPTLRFRRMRRWMMRSTIGAAACVLIGLVVWFGLVKAPETLYGQVLAAIEKVGTVHLVVKEHRDGQWVKLAEAWYERGVGCAEYEYRDNNVKMRIDNGTYQWSHRSDQDFAVRARSKGKLRLVEKTLRANARVLEDEKRFKRDPSGDKEINGVKCRLYVRTYPKKTTEVHLWIDGADRMRRWERRRQRDGKWETYQVVNVQYEVPIDRSRFQGKFGPSVRMIVATDLMEARFGLEKAVFKKDLMGLVFAVHELRRCDNGMIYVVCSIRPSQAVIRELGAISSVTMGRKVYGDFQLDSSWRRVNGKEWSYQPIRLGELYHDGVQVTWVLLDPLGAWPKDAETCELSVYAHTRGKLQEKRKQAGLEWWRRFRPLAELALPAEKLPLKEALEKVHADALAAEPLDGYVGLLEASRQRKDGTRSRVHRRPSEISPEQFADEIEREFEHLEQMRRESKQKSRSPPSK